MASLIVNLLMMPFITLISFSLIIYYHIVNLVRQFIPYKYRSKSIKGQVVLVTGSGSGLGRSMSKKFARLGCKLILLDVNKDGNEETKNSIIQEGGSATTFTCDLSSREDIYKVCDEIKRKVGDIDILVNNAGIVTGKKFLESTDAAIEKTFQVNTLAHFWLCKAFLPKMIEKNHGHIVTIASVAGVFGAAGLCDYCSSKFAAVGFEESLRNELARLGKDGVHTTLVCPYFINTGMFAGARSEVIPFLEPEYVTDKIMEAVLTNQQVLFLPKTMYIVNFLKAISPVATESFTANHIFKTNHSMDTFVGRRKDN